MAKKEDSAADAQSTEKRSPAVWFAAKKSREWAYDGARFAEQWPEGIEITEADYDAAIGRVEDLPYSSPGVLTQPATPLRGKRWLSRA